MTEYQVIEQSVIGTGFDFWLGFKEHHENYDPDNFLNGRLELSGINKGSQSKISQRVKEKLRQLKVSDYLQIPAYVVVTEFGTPVSIIFDNE